MSSFVELSEGAGFCHRQSLKFSYLVLTLIEYERLFFKDMIPNTQEKEMCAPTYLHQKYTSEYWEGNTERKKYVHANLKNSRVDLCQLF